MEFILASALVLTSSLAHGVANNELNGLYHAPDLHQHHAAGYLDLMCERQLLPRLVRGAVASITPVQGSVTTAGAKPKAAPTAANYPPSQNNPSRNTPAQNNQNIPPHQPQNMLALPLHHGNILPNQREATDPTPLNIEKVLTVITHLGSGVEHLVKGRSAGPRPSPRQACCHWLFSDVVAGRDENAKYYSTAIFELSFCNTFMTDNTIRALKSHRARPVVRKLGQASSRDP
ncbi:hypothetical protein BDK51DRAFT_37862 [Blyttiomyces helicus]|uniref:Uncharacterized protein n=1 Tax=Blyttiomyces helicus TaxID=388810 RepID=A0A4P9WFP6_9FUNG|nr:hypothetical protein BDK51DRAFT_37862 [Blyttiomyces helicus]|eukprot:RKO89256.1 hypothetical protein BDK51DRAFT_37862 [Blyttiomyces helicus]